MDNMNNELLPYCGLCNTVGQFKVADAIKMETCLLCYVFTIKYLVIWQTPVSREDLQ